MITPHVAANDNHPIPPMLERAPDESVTDWMRRRISVTKKSEPAPESGESVRHSRSPFLQEYIAGRVSLQELLIAEHITSLLEIEGRIGGTHNPRDIAPDRLNGPELHTHLRRNLQRLRYAAGHLWQAVEWALVDEKTMAEIGRLYGAGNDVAPAVGRAKVLDGLDFIARERRMLDREAA